jgi:hypothetical protein
MCNDGKIVAIDIETGEFEVDEPSFCSPASLQTQTVGISELLSQQGFLNPTRRGQCLHLMSEKLK